MAASFKWNVDNMDVTKDLDHKTDVVTQVHWRLIASDAEYHSSAYGSVALDPPDDSFIAFQDLTPGQVIEWAKAKIFTGEEGAQTEDSVKAALTEQIENQKAPKVVNKFPDSWVA